MSPHISPMWSECIVIYGIESYYSHSQHAPHILLHAVRVARHMASMSPRILPHVVRVAHHILPMWPECIAICCINSYCSHSQHVPAYIAPCGQSGSPYGASIHTVHIVSVFPHILPHVVRVSCDIRYQFTLSQHVPAYIAHVVRVSRDMLYQFMLST